MYKIIFKQKEIADKQIIRVYIKRMLLRILFYISILPLQIFLIDLHLSQCTFHKEKSVFGSSFFFKNEDFCTFTSAISSPFSKDTTFYLYNIVNVDSMYTYHFLLTLLLTLLLAVTYLLLLTRNLFIFIIFFKKSLS